MEVVRKAGMKKEQFVSIFLFNRQARRLSHRLTRNAFSQILTGNLFARPSKEVGILILPVHLITILSVSTSTSVNIISNSNQRAIELSKSTETDAGNSSSAVHNTYVTGIVGKGKKRMALSP
jgi:hypothetical protein